MKDETRKVGQREDLTELNIAVRVSRVVMPIPTLPGTDSGGMKSDSQASTWKIMLIITRLIKFHSELSSFSLS